jgi:hypothetical protein
VTWSAHGLEPDAQGKLNIALTPVRNYACVNAVEVLDESKVSRESPYVTASGQPW